MGETLVLWTARVVLIGICLLGWFWSQRLIADRDVPRGSIDDALHRLTARLNRHLQEYPRRADLLLIATSLIVDLLTLFVLAMAIFGSSFEPFVGLLVLFVLRQLCQGLCNLPVPDGQIWRDPGFPTLFVTYETKGDLFFSGHTAIAVYAGIQLAALGTPLWITLGIAVAAVQIVAVLVLRAHYTMDVFTAIVTAFWVSLIGETVALPIDNLLGLLVSSVGWLTSGLTGV